MWSICGAGVAFTGRFDRSVVAGSGVLFTPRPVSRINEIGVRERIMSLLQSLFQIGNNICNSLDPHGNAQRIRGCICCRLLFRR